nr:MAG TPA: hypothetical protein [Caudoviricetes sp.]
MFLNLIDIVMYIIILLIKNQILFLKLSYFGHRNFTGLKIKKSPQSRRSFNY